MKAILKHLLLIIPFFGLCQVEDFQEEITDSSIDSVNWDAFPIIELDAIEVYSIRLNSDLEKKYYIWLERRVDDVYPFVYVAVNEYYHIQDSAQLIQSKRKRRKFIKKRYNALADTYEEKLKNLTTSRGQILSKLIYRETGKTAYEIIKELRGGFNAFMWNTAGGAFNINLKEEFDPKKTREDLYLEVIINRGIQSGKYKRIYNSEPLNSNEEI